MITLFCILMTGIITNIISAVILIRIGGWLPILVAVLSLMFTMLISGICMLGIDGYSTNKNKEGEIK